MGFTTGLGQSVGKKRGGFQPGVPLATVRWDAKALIRIVDEVTGNFRSHTFYSALADVHRGAAISIQEGMVEELDRMIGHGEGSIYTARPQRPGRRLALAILNENNRDVTANTFTVGIRDWMNVSPAAAYWRQIEEGNTSSYKWNVQFFSPWAPPWVQGGVTQTWRKGGGISRNEPPGYLHGRMPQGGRKSVPSEVGPFPALHYERGGLVAFRTVTGSMESRYRNALAGVGITLTKSMLRGIGK